jgi:putative ABC transport system ATP-binding protein
MPIADDNSVVLAGVHKRYPHAGADVLALRGVDLTIPRGQFAGVMGASGSGKSTLLHVIGGLDRPDEGVVRVGGQELNTLGDRQRTLFRRRRVGVVFQSFNLVDTLSAIENIALPMIIDGGSPKAVRRRAQDLLDRVGLTHRADHRPDALSGGEQQRVAIARALLMDPEILLADEPTGNLDSANAAAIWSLLGALCRDLNKTVLVGTHEPAVGAVADRVLVLKDGRLVGTIDTAEYANDPTLVATRSQELAG